MSSVPLVLVLGALLLSTPAVEAQDGQAKRLAKIELLSPQKER